MSDPKIAGSIKKINTDTNQLKSQINKIEKLIKTGDKALTSINNIEKNLNDAQDYRDNRNPGSGALAYEEIGNARHLMSKTIPVLNRLQNDLTNTYADIQLDANIRFAMFAKYSGIISHDTISEFLFKLKVDSSMSSISGIGQKLSIVLTFLNHELDEFVEKFQTLEEERKRIILEAE